MFQSLLVPLDGSPFSEHALPLAVSLARRTGAALHLLYVHSPLAWVYPEAYPVDDEAYEYEIKTQQRVYLESLVKRIKSEATMPVTFELLEGEVVPTIRREADRVAADLVVMTTHGRGALARFWLGSVADQLVRELPAPLILVRPTDKPPDWQQEVALKHILIPLDGSPLAEDILGPALDLGAVTGADYTLLQVIPSLFPRGTAPEFGHALEALTAGRQELQDKLRREAQDYLTKVALRLGEHGTQVQTRVIAEEQAATGILNEAKAGMNLIALATHGRRGLVRLMLGSVADKVIRGSTVPVLVHRPATK